MFQKWTEKRTEFTFWRTLNWTQFTFLPNELELNLVHFLAKWTRTELSSHLRWTSTSLNSVVLSKILKIAMLKSFKMNWIFQFIFVQVHPKSELSSVQVQLAKKWTKFSSSSPKKWTFELNWTFPFSSSTSLNLSKCYISKKIAMLK